MLIQQKHLNDANEVYITCFQGDLTKVINIYSPVTLTDSDLSHPISLEIVTILSGMTVRQAYSVEQPQNNPTAHCFFSVLQAEIYNEYDIAEADRAVKYLF